MDDRDALLIDPNEGSSIGAEIPVKVREKIQASLNHARTERLAEELPAPRPSQKPKRGLVSSPSVSENERMWAAISHASILLTIALGISSAGLGSFITVFIPLGIYFYFHDRSAFVAHHALQAFAAQVVGIIGFAILMVAMVAVWFVLLLISIVLILVLIGIPLTIIVTIAGLIAIPATLILPFMTLIYGMIATVEAWRGEAYHYPWIGDWVDEQLYDV